MIQFKHSINALPSSASVGNMEKNHRFATAAYVLAWCQQILYSLQLSVSSTISCLFPNISIFLPTRLGFHSKIGPPFFRTLQIYRPLGNCQAMTYLGTAVLELYKVARIKGSRCPDDSPAGCAVTGRPNGGEAGKLGSWL